MSAQHDVGGRSEFFGPIVREADEPVFHARWEARIFAISTFLHTLFGPNLDSNRALMERLPSDEYAGPYYRRWLAATEQAMSPYLTGDRSVPRLKVIGTAQVLRHVMARRRLPRVINARVMPRITGGAARPVRPARFERGDVVRVRAELSNGHTREPAYVAGRTGTVGAHLGAAVFADRNSQNDLFGARRPIRGSKEPEHLYTVVFEGTELWGDRAEQNTEVRVDLFEPYLELA